MMISKQLKSLSVIILFCIYSNVYAQGIEVTGRVVDAQSGEVLTGATVQLIGERIFSTTSNKNGDFRFFPLPPGFYNFQVSFVGYEPYVLEYIDITSRKSLGSIKLQQSKTEIRELTVQGKTPLATVRGDTMEYNADHYKTNPDADAQDLVAKMPGIIVEDGTVQAQGEDVKKVYVDGKPFFDQDPTLALKTLPADIIQKIEVFDEQSEQAQFTGFDDGETSKVMNVVTRLQMRNGQFGRVYAGYGYKNKYMLGGNVSVFDGDRRISIIAQSNNVNQQNFSNEDLLGVLSSGSSRRGGGGASSQDFMVGNQNGITTSHALGINYTDKWGEKLDVSGSYFFNASDNNKVEEAVQTYLTDVDSFSQVYNENAESESMNYNHRLHFRLNYNINEQNRLIIQPRLSFQSNNSETENKGYSYINDSLYNTYVNTYDADRQGYSFSNRMTFMHKFDKDGRTLSLSSNQGINTNNSESTQFTESIESATGLKTDSLNQLNDNDTKSKSFSLRAMYTEPIGESSQLSINATSSLSYSDNDKRVFNYDYSGEAYSQTDTFLSNVYESSYNTQQLGGAFMHRWGTRNIFMFNLNYERASLSSDQLFPDNTNLERTYHSVLPMLRVKIDMGMSKRFDMFYRTNTSSPSVTQLQNTIDNSNTLQLSSGNPLLEPSFEHNFNLRYNSSNTEKGTVFFIMGNVSYTQNYVGNDTWYATQDTIIGDDVLLQSGGQFSMPVNLDHYWSLRAFSAYGFPVSLIRSNFNFNFGYNYSYTPGIYNNENIYSENHVFSGGLTLASNISENVDFTISSRTNYNSTHSSYLTSNNDYLTQKIEGKLSLIFPYGIVFRGSLASQYYYWTASQEEESFMMLNLELGKKFGKKQQAELKLAVYDVLNQNQSYSRSVTDIYVEDVRSNVLQRYAMLTFSYRLRNFRM